MVKEAKIRGNVEKSSSISEESIKLLVQNSLALQKIMADLAIDIKKLSKNVSELLEVFKEASKTLAEEKAEGKVKEEEMADLKNKIDALLEQNKTIAQGILLLESLLKPKEAHYSPQYSGSY